MHLTKGLTFFACASASFNSQFTLSITTVGQLEKEDLMDLGHCQWGISSETEPYINDNWIQNIQFTVQVENFVCGKFCDTWVNSKNEDSIKKEHFMVHVQKLIVFQ